MLQIWVSLIKALCWLKAHYHDNDAQTHASWRHDDSFLSLSTSSPVQHLLTSMSKKVPISATYNTFALGNNSTTFSQGWCWISPFSDSVEPVICTKDEFFPSSLLVWLSLSELQIPGMSAQRQKTEINTPRASPDNKTILCLLAFLSFCLLRSQYWITLP